MSDIIRAAGGVVVRGKKNFIYQEKWPVGVSKRKIKKKSQ
jgi:hypothetical protein